MLFEVIALFYYSIAAGIIYAKKKTMFNLCNKTYESDSEDEPEFQDLSRIVMGESTFPADFSSIHERNIY